MSLFNVLKIAPGTPEPQSVLTLAGVPGLVAAVGFINRLQGSDLRFLIFSLWIDQHASHTDQFANCAKHGIHYILLVFHLIYFFTVPPK